MELKVHISNPLKDIFNDCYTYAVFDNHFCRIQYIYTLAYYENIYDQIL